MIIQPDTKVILASASPRRKELLSQLGLKFDILPAHIDESMLENEDPIKHVCRLSKLKAESIAKNNPSAFIIASDTIVVYNGQILGKPISEEDAFRMLKLLSGHFHEVITAFSIVSQDREININEYEITEVHFRELSEEDIKNYIAGGSPMDKAGAYGIQDVDAYLVDKIMGSYHNVIGFPVSHFALVWNEIINQ